MYATRDGEFHWEWDTNDNVFYLRDKWGNYVMNANAYAPNGLQSFATLGTWSEVVYSTQNPPRFDIEGTSVAALMQRPGIVIINRLSELKFSKFGSTVFDIRGYALDNSDGFLASGPYSVDGIKNGQVVTYALEASNASLTQSVPQMTLAQKFYTALAKLLQTNLQNIDSVINLIR